MRYQLLIYNQYAVTTMNYESLINKIMDFCFESNY